MISVEYLAGFVDGEGYLGIARIQRRGRSPEYCVRVSVYNTNYGILKEMRKTYGGTLSAPGQRNPAWKPAFALIWTNAAAVRLLRSLAPFLVVKARQAEALLAFDVRVHTTRRSRDRAGHLRAFPIGELRVRDAFYKRVKELNRRGQYRRKWLAQAGGTNGRKLSPRYVAGFVDAEGALMITKSRNSTRRAPEYRARISVSNTNRDVLEAIQREYGGIMADQPARQIGWSHAYQLVWSEGMIGSFLAIVGPHLMIKRSQARVLTGFIEHRRTKRRSRGASGFANLMSLAASREGFRQKILGLNAKGPRRGTPRTAMRKTEWWD